MSGGVFRSSIDSKGSRDGAIAITGLVLLAVRTSICWGGGLFLLAMLFEINYLGAFTSTTLRRCLTQGKKTLYILWPWKS